MAAMGSGVLRCPLVSAPSCPQGACVAAVSQGGRAATQGPPQPCPPRSLSQVEGLRATMAQRLVRMLQICAGHVPGISALNLLSLMRCPENPFQEDL